MVFVNESSLMVTWNDGKCLEVIQFPDMKITTYAGLCKTLGATYDTHRLDMRIGGPVGIAYDEKELIYASIIQSKIIVAINVTSDIGMEFCSTEDKPRYLSIDQLNGDIFLSMGGGFGVLRAENPEEGVVKLTGDGNGIGNFSNTKIQTGNGIVQMDREVWIMADYELHR